ncbi:SPOR domain-containing protein [Shewanella sp. AS16]|uniref:SPOR domain-containing protein n=1 Tax=Shewanella sp. AS16 TaxID=2907625 RepID=UPI001F3886D3|nr:SPOR domain-containing protein [Shewanella sp. AS16]MCE9686847.1 SPOR domain-containing protein [Shewanella sp. AS16]
MSTQFHNRLVGTVVLVALGVIFLPDILDGKKAQQEEQFSEIPLRPTLAEQTSDDALFEALSVALASGDEAVTDPMPEEAQTDGPAAAAGEQAPEQQQPKTQAKTQPKAQTKAQARTALTAGWTLQLGSFKNAANVNALVNQLRKAGFTAYTLPHKPVDGALTKVFVGPDVSEAKVKKVQQAVEKLTQLKGRVVPYNPQET